MHRKAMGWPISQSQIVLIIVFLLITGLWLDRKMSQVQSDHGNRNSASNDHTADVTAIFVTASSEDEAKTIAKGLLERNLVACVNMVPQVTSIYRWEGKIEESKEILMIIKVRGFLPLYSFAEGNCDILKPKHANMGFNLWFSSNCNRHRRLVQH
jgi:CutA1 divalent ion tolerance protein